MENQINNKIRVGIIGLGGWAKYGHIPVLQALKDNYEIVAVTSRKKETAEQYAANFGITHAFDNEQELINHPDVDMVLITAPAPEHQRLVKAVIKAGKDVYSEWPLTTKTADSEELLTLAEAKGVRHLVGLQRRLGPAARYFSDLIKQGYIGKVRAAHMIVSVDAFPDTMPGRYEWAFKAENFSNVLSVYAAHFGIELFQAVGFPKKLTAVMETQFPFFTIAETGEQVPNKNPNEIMVIGTLENGGLFSIQIEGGQKHKTGLQIDISGTEGVLKITNPRGFENKEDNNVYGMNGDQTSFVHLPVPVEYRTLPVDHLDASTQDMAYLYDAFARDKKNGTTEASNFSDALKQHNFIDQIIEASAGF
jgi:predicted dehydrogenase